MTQSRPAPAFVHHGALAAGAPLLLGLPAMGTPARYYEPFARALADAAGASVAFADLRGQGTHPQRARDGADFGYREIVEHDLPALVDALAAAHPGRPLVLLGHSLGGQLATLAAHQIADRLAGLVLVAAGTAHHRSWPAGARWRARLAVGAVRAAATLLPWYPGDRLGFGGAQPKRLMRDWAFNATTGHYALEGSAVDHERATRRVELPVLSLAVRHDPVAPRGAIEELLALLESARITRAAMDGVIADPRWRRHFSWARRPAEATAHVARWLRRLPLAVPFAAPPGRTAPTPLHTPEGALDVLA